MRTALDLFRGLRFGGPSTELAELTAAVSRAISEAVERNTMGAPVVVVLNIGRLNVRVQHNEAHGGGASITVREA